MRQGMMIGIKYLMFWLVLLGQVYSQDAQNFTYWQSDTIVIKSRSSSGIYGSLTTSADEYLSSSSINITNQIQQFGENKANFATFNVYYFNLTSELGMDCYRDWVMGEQIPNQSTCPQISYLYSQDCHNYSGCFDENITYSLALNEWEYVQHIFYIENTHPLFELNLKTRVGFILISSNAWFFWAVGLTCLLMIMIVVLTGVVFNLNLKMNRTKKIYQQYKLTVQNEIDFGLHDDHENKSD